MGKITILSWNKANSLDFQSFSVTIEETVNLLEGKKMRYTVQTFSSCGNFAVPQTDEVHRADNKREAEDVLDFWADEVERYAERQHATALVWKGEYDDTTDVYPDFELTIGPKGGIAWNPC
jgi:hypothetical protein